jgi:hypothetical protein
MGWMIRAWTVAFCLWAFPSYATTLDPWAFTSLGALNASDAIRIDTDTLQLTGGASYTGVLDPVSGAGIFTFDDITGTNLSIFGTRTLGLLSTGNISFTGTIDLLGTGGLEMVAVGSLALNNLNAVGSGRGDIQLEANQFSLTGAITVVNRSLSVTSATDIILPGSPIPVIPVRPPRLDATVPVPAAVLLFATGLAGLGAMKMRKG